MCKCAFQNQGSRKNALQLQLKSSSEDAVTPSSKSRSSLCSALSLSPCHCASPFPLLTLLCSCCNNAPTFMARNAAGSWQTNALRLSWHATASSRHGRHPPEAEHSKSVSPADISNVCKHISSAQLLLPSRCCAATAGSVFISTFAIFHSILFCAGFKSRLPGSLQLQLGKIRITRFL